MNILIFDVETTGTNAERDQIIELCIQQGLEDGSNSQTWRFKPSVKIHPEAQKVHGISMDDLIDCPPFAENTAEIRSLVESADILVGYNISFDLSFLQAEFSRIKQPLNVANKLLVDPYQLWRHFEPRSLSAAHERFVGEKFEGAHSATEDVAATARVLVGMRSAFELDKTEWKKIAELCGVSTKRGNWIGPSYHFIWRGTTATVGFGKHRNRAIVELAQEQGGGYLKWMASNDFPEHAKLIAQQAISMDEAGFNQWLVDNFGGSSS